MGAVLVGGVGFGATILDPLWWLSERDGVDTGRGNDGTGSDQVLHGGTNVGAIVERYRGSVERRGLTQVGDTRRVAERILAGELKLSVEWVLVEAVNGKVRRGAVEVHILRCEPSLVGGTSPRG